MKPRIFAVTMPKWGIEMQQGTIAEWHAAAGVAVQKGDHLVDVETDKIVNAVEAPASGVLRRIIADTGSTENVGALVGVLAESSVTEDEVALFVRNFKPIDASFEPNDSEHVPAPAPVADEAPPSDGEARISPIARRIAERLGVDVTAVKGTGRNGRVSKEDVEAYAANRDAPAAAPASTGAAIPLGGAPQRVEMTAMRSAIARRLLESKQGIPHYRLSVDVDFGALTAHRAGLAAQSGRVSVNDLLVRACALVLVKHPAVNAQFVDKAILQFPHADICIAVAAGNGLVTPVIRSADQKTAAQIGVESKDLAARGRNGQLSREEITGGSFTISNLGMFGIDRFDAIINPPQVAILAVGAVEERAVVRNGGVVVAPVATLTLSADHRVVDGAVGAQFLKDLKSLIEAPQSL